MSPCTTDIVIPAAIRGRGLRRTPGEMVVDRDGVAFRVPGARVFRVPLADVEEVAWPWWWFGSRLLITVRGERYRVTFGPPDEQRSSGSDQRNSADSAGDPVVYLVIWLLQILVGMVDRSAERAPVRRLRTVLRPTARKGDERSFAIPTSSPAA